MSSGVSGPGVVTLAGLAARVRAADPLLKTHLRDRVGAHAGPLAAAVRASALATPATHYDEGLRRQVAEAITASRTATAAGVRLSVTCDTERMPPGKRSLPGHMDARGGWGHPVFARPGRRRVWVRQWSRPRWFEDPVSRRRRDLRRACEQAMDDTCRDLSH